MKTTASSTMGGIVWKLHSGQRTIAVVRNRNGGGGWALPVLYENGVGLSRKARIQKIGEIIGTEVEQLQTADTLFYPEWDPPRFVIYWHLQVKANAKHVQPADGTEVLWLSANRASELLNNISEKRLVRHLKYPGKKEKQTQDVLPIDIEFSGISNGSSDDEEQAQLEGDIQSFSAELEHSIRENLLEDGSLPAWGEQAAKLIKNAAGQLRKGNIHAAKKCLDASKRLEFFSLDDKQVSQKADQIRLEAIELNERGKEEIYQILGEKIQSKNGLDHKSLFLAAQIRDDCLRKKEHLNKLRKNVFNSLLIIFSVSIVLLIAYFGSLIYIGEQPLISSSGGQRVLSEFSLLTGIFLFGVLGGVASSLFKIKSVATAAELPEYFYDHIFTTLRVLVGGAAAILLFILLESGFGNLYYLNVSIRPESHFTYFILAFASGFAERLWMVAVSRITD